MRNEYRFLHPALRQVINAQARRLYDVHWTARGVNVEIVAFERIAVDAQDAWRDLAIWTMNQIAEVRQSALADRETRFVAVDTALSDEATKWLEEQTEAEVKLVN